MHLCRSIARLSLSFASASRERIVGIVEMGKETRISPLKILRCNNRWLYISYSFHLDFAFPANAAVVNSTEAHVCKKDVSNDN